MIRRPPRSTLDRSSAASDVYKRQTQGATTPYDKALALQNWFRDNFTYDLDVQYGNSLSLIHISEPTRPY